MKPIIDTCKTKLCFYYDHLFNGFLYIKIDLTSESKSIFEFRLFPKYIVSEEDGKFKATGKIRHGFSINIGNRE